MILDSGKSAIDLTLYILLPILVVMMALMKLLEAKGVLAFVAKVLSPILRLFGLPGAGVFALLQLLFVNFAAPVATLSVMERDGTSKREIAATLAMILTMSQANVVFPLLALGLNLPAILLTSIIGGFSASSLTYYLFARGCADKDRRASRSVVKQIERIRNEGVFSQLVDGGRAGVEIALKSIPLLILTLFVVNILKAIGGISFIQLGLSPALSKVGLPGIAVLPMATKYVAGGTAMLGVTVDLIKDGPMTPQVLNRMAGFVINPLDFVGVGVLMSAGPRVASVKWPAIFGAIAGVLIRGLLHLMLF